MVHRSGCHFFCWVIWRPVLCTVQSSYIIKTNGKRKNSWRSFCNTKSFAMIWLPLPIVPLTWYLPSLKLGSLAKPILCNYFVWYIGQVIFSVESYDNLSYVLYKVVTEDGLGLCAPSLDDLQYIMRLLTTNTTQKKQKHINTMISPPHWLPAASIL